MSVQELVRKAFNEGGCAHEGALTVRINRAKKPRFFINGNLTTKKRAEKWLES